MLDLVHNETSSIDAVKLIFEVDLLPFLSTFTFGHGLQVVGMERPPSPPPPKEGTKAFQQVPADLKSCGCRNLLMSGMHA